MFNFNLLASASYTNYFNVNSTRGIELIVTLSLISLLLLVGIAIYFFKRNYIKKYIVYSILILVIFAISIILSNIIIDAKDKAFKIENVDCRAWLENLDYISISIIGSIIIGILLFTTPFIIDKESKFKENTTKSIAFAGICIALSFGLSYIRIFKGPYGGSITVASLLPLALYSYIFGSKKGLIAGLIIGALQFMQDPYFYHILQFLLDYILPFGCVGMCSGLLKKYLKPILALPIGLGIGVLLRFVCHFISGAVFFGVWAPEEFNNIWVYSFVYNISYVLPDGIISIVAGIALFTSKAFVNQINLLTNNNSIIKDTLLAK